MTTPESGVLRCKMASVCEPSSLLFLHVKTAFSIHLLLIFTINAINVLERFWSQLNLAKRLLCLSDIVRLFIILNVFFLSFVVIITKIPTLMSLLSPGTAESFSLKLCLYFIVYALKFAARLNLRSTQLWSEKPLLHVSFVPGDQWPGTNRSYLGHRTKATWKHLGQS